MQGKKKALILGEAFYPEDFLINDLVKEWERVGYKIEVLTRTPSYPYGKIYKGYKNKIYQTTRFNTVKVHRFPVIQGYEKNVILKILNYFSFVFWSFLIVLFIGKRFNKVFIYQTGPLTLATAGILLKKMYGAKVTIWSQDLWPETVYAYGFKQTKLLSLCLNTFVKWVYKNSDHILVSCESFINRIHRYVPEKKIEYIPNWSLMEYEPLNPQILPGKFNFTFAGNIGKVQNLENVIIGFAQFVERHPESYLNIIGDGSYLGELKDIVCRENIRNVNFEGRKPLSEMSDYYNASDALIISLKDEPIYEDMIPSKFQTYLVTNKPIYAVMKGEVRKIVEENHIGLGVDPNNINEIALGFEFFLGLSESELKRMSTNSTCLLSNVFNRDIIIENINNVFWKTI